ncbi:hypothetical protein SMICM304S_03833 [Streptomyces microflavus]
MAESRSGSSVLSGRCSVASRNGAAGSMPSGSAGAGCSPAFTASRMRRQMSTITSPASRDLSARPSSARWRMASSVGASSRSAQWSVRTRLCSSGIRRLKDRRPASRWATGRCIFTADSAPATVELVSP